MFLIERQRRHEITFGQIYFARPSTTEADGTTLSLFPQEARMRNLTYSGALYIDVTRRILTANGVEDPIEADWQPAVDEYGQEIDVVSEKMFIGKLPVMVRSNYCVLDKLPETEYYSNGECTLDIGGYFIVKGSEKVLIGQERMAFNTVYTFRKSSTSGFTFYSTVTSQVERSAKISEMEVRLYPRGGIGGSGAVIRVKIPKIKVDIPVVVVFRALGIVPDRDVLQHIAFDENDNAMLEMMQPSIEEAFAVQDREAALDFIGRRAQAEAASKTQRQRIAFDILQMELLPHVSTSEGFETKKAYFLGYMVQRLISAALGRKELDDRDHFGNKRLDLAGPLLANLFRQLFYRFTKRIRDELQKVR